MDIDIGSIPYQICFFKGDMRMADLAKCFSTDGLRLPQTKPTRSGQLSTLQISKCDADLQIVVFLLDAPPIVENLMWNI